MTFKSFRMKKSQDLPFFNDECCPTGQHPHSRSLPCLYSPHVPQASPPERLVYSLSIPYRLEAGAPCPAPCLAPCVAPCSAFLPRLGYLLRRHPLEPPPQLLPLPLPLVHLHLFAFFTLSFLAPPPLPPLQTPFSVPQITLLNSYIL